MPKPVTVTEARANLASLIDRVVAGEEVTVTRHGTAVAVLIRPESLNLRRARSALKKAALIHESLERARATPLHIRPSMSAASADALVAEVRAGRRIR